MTLKQMLDNLVEGKKILDKESETLLTALKDLSIPLDDRWDAFEGLVKNHILIKDDGYGSSKYVDSPYDDLYMERGSTITFPDAYEILEERDEMSADELDVWREKVLASGFSSFTYDW